MPKHSFSKMSLPARCAMVTVISVVFAFALCMIMSAVSMASDDPTKNLTLYGEICFGASMCFCGFLGAKTAAENRFASGIISGGMMLILVIAASIVFGGESFVKEAIIAVLGFITSAAGAALGSRETRRKHKR